MKNTASNCKSLTGLPSLINELKNIVMNALKELQGAGSELQENLEKAITIKSACNKKGLKTPKECYLECGKPINPTPKEKKEWLAKRKSKGSKKVHKAANKK